MKNTDMGGKGAAKIAFNKTRLIPCLPENSSGEPQIRTPHDGISRLSPNGLFHQISALANLSLPLFDQSPRHKRGRRAIRCVDGSCQVLARILEVVEPGLEQAPRLPQSVDFRV